MLQLSSPVREPIRVRIMIRFRLMIRVRIVSCESAELM